MTEQPAETRYLVPHGEGHSVTVAASRGDIEMACTCGAAVPLPGLLRLADVIAWAGRHVGRPDNMELSVVIEHRP